MDLAVPVGKPGAVFFPPMGENFVTASGEADYKFLQEVVVVPSRSGNHAPTVAPTRQAGPGTGCATVRAILRAAP